MKVTYIHHSAVSVETEHSILLFDYFKGELPDFDPGKPLFIFASHFHEDHYSPVIFERFRERKGVSYILSNDIKGRRIPKEALPLIHFVKPGQTLELGELKIQTYKSTDEGCAFWVSLEGLELYHAGDLNNWWWEGEDKAWNHNMAANYRREVEKIAADHPEGADAAFIPLDPRQEQWFYLGMDDFLKKVEAKAVFPIHFWGDFGVSGRMKALPCSGPYRDRIMEIQREGEEFEL